MAKKVANAKRVKKAAGKGQSADESVVAECRAQARRVVRGMKKLYADADCALVHGSSLELLIATILSAQSTDVTVNKVTPALFKRYPSATTLAEAESAEVEEIIHATGFFRQKTKSIINACKQIVETFDGQVPATIEELTQLPGVARKTANVVLGTWFGKNEGVVVDTHVGRLAHRLGLTWTSKDTKDAVKIEQDLMAIIPRKEWTFVAHALVWHGRKVCTARKPSCDVCTLSKVCPTASTWDAPANKPAGKKTKRKGAR